MVSAAVAVAGALLVVNVVTWAAFRVDKARAGRQARRIRERTLLTLAACGGGPGGLVAMYVHRRRHKVAKRGFAAVVWLATLAQLGLAAWWVTTRR